MMAKKNSNNIVLPLEELVAEIDSEISAIKQQISETETPAAPLISHTRPCQYIRFFLEDILLAIPLSSVIEVSHKPRITPLPNLPAWILGVSNIRGEIISVADLKMFFEMPLRGRVSQPDSHKRIIIVRNEEMKVCLVVDKLTGIFSLDSAHTSIQENPYKEGIVEGMKAGKLAFYISGVVTPDSEKNLLNILDIDKIVTSPRMTAFQIER